MSVWLVYLVTYELDRTLISPDAIRHTASPVFANCCQVNGVLQNGDQIHFVAHPSLARARPCPASRFRHEEADMVKKGSMLATPSLSVSEGPSIALLAGLAPVPSP